MIRGLGGLTIALAAATLASAAPAAVHGPGSGPDRIELHERWRLEASASEVAPEGTVTLRLLQDQCLPAGNGTDMCLGRITDLEDVAVEWRVNGVPVGTPETGLLRAGSRTIYSGLNVNESGRVSDVVYVAPSQAPSPNTVDVTAVVTSLDSPEVLQLNASISIIDTKGWRGSFHVRFKGTDDPYAVVEDRSVTDLDEQARERDREARQDDPSHPSDERVAFALEPSLTDLNGQPKDLAIVETSIQYTVRGAISEAFSDDGSGIVVLEVRPDGIMNYLRRTNDACGAGELTVASGGQDMDVYDTTPLYITVNLQTDHAPVIAYLPNVGIQLRGSTDSWTCDSGGGGLPTRPFETLVDGSGIQGDLVGRPGDGRSFAGEATAPLTVQVEGRDVHGLAAVTWSLSRKD